MKSKSGTARRPDRRHRSQSTAARPTVNKNTVAGDVGRVIPIMKNSSQGDNGVNIRRRVVEKNLGEVLEHIQVVVQVNIYDGLFSGRYRIMADGDETGMAENIDAPVIIIGCRTHRVTAAIVPVAVPNNTLGGKVDLGQTCRSAGFNVEYNVKQRTAGLPQIRTDAGWASVHVDMVPDDLGGVQPSVHQAAPVRGNTDELKPGVAKDEEVKVFQEADFIVTVDVHPDAVFADVSGGGLDSFLVGRRAGRG